MPEKPKIITVNGEEVNVNDFFRGNTKVKSYRDGSYTVIYSNQRIFKQPDTADITCNSFDDFNRLSKLLPDGELIINNKPVRVVSEEQQEIKEKWIEKLKREHPDKYAEIQEQKRLSNMKHAIDKVYDIVFQNDWSYFLTGTISPEHGFDRDNPTEVYKKLGKWLNHQVDRSKLRYLLIPEYHPERGEGIHFHALTNDKLPVSDSGRLLLYNPNSGKSEMWKRETLIKRRVDVSKLKTVYNCSAWKYGWSTAIPVDGTPAALACYMTKYITKDCKKIFGKYYLSSRSCVREADIKVMTTTGFQESAQKPVNKFGLQLKYESDFLLRDGSTRNPTEEILKYLAEHEVDVYSYEK